MKVGLDCKAYYLSTGTRATWDATPTSGVHIGAAPANLVEVGEVQDININLEKSTGDASIRASAYDLVTKTGARVLSIDMTIPANEASTFYGKIRDAYFGDGSIAMCFLSGDKATTGSEGPWADWAVTGFNRGETRGDTSMYNVTLKPTLASATSVVYPEWVKVG